jgi:glycine cleavage system H protein
MRKKLLKTECGFRIAECGINNSRCLGLNSELRSPNSELYCGVKEGAQMNIEGYEFPEGLYYDKNHFWARVEGDLVVMGMNEYAQKMAGSIVYVGLPPEGKKLTQGKNFTKIESGKWLGKVFSVVSGELVAVNEELERKAKLINEDCYGKGWMFKIKPDNLDELKNLMTDPEVIREWLKGEIAQHGKK